MVSRHEVQRISDFAEIKTGPFGSALHQADYKATGTPIVTVEHLGERGIIHENLPLVGEEDLKRLSTYKCREGDILFSRVGSIDRNAIVKREEVDWLFSGRLLRVRVDRRKVDSGYLSQVFHTESFKDKVRSVAVGQTMPSLNTQILGGLTVNLPSLDEQKVVAGRLGSADQLIESLKRLISKKQAIKQGMVQQLLSGRTRLPGFIKDWTRSIAGELGVFKGGIGFPVWAQGGKSGAYPFFKVSDMNLPGNETVMKTSNNWISENIRRRLAATVLPAGAIVFAKVGAAVYLERKRILGIPSCVDNNMAAFIPDSTQIDNRFAYYYLLSFPLSSLVAMGALPSLNSSQLRSIPFHFPEDIEEQKAIAQILQDADQEIATLERRLESARNIKQGMMQELLTGRTRLPVEEVSS